MKYMYLFTGKDKRERTKNVSKEADSQRTVGKYTSEQ